MGRQRCPVPTIRYSGVEFPLEVFSLWGLALTSGDDDRVLRNGNFRTPSGPGGSSGKEALSCAAGEPGRS